MPSVFRVMRLAPLLAALAFVVGCPAVPKESALHVIDDLDRLTAETEKAHQDLIHDLLIQIFTQLNSRLEAESAAKEAQAVVEIFRMTEQKSSELSNQAVGQLTGALQPALSQMRKELELEKEKLRTGTGGSRARELELASQYASTLAISTHEAEKMRDDIDTQLHNARENAIRDLHSKVQAMDTPLDPDKEATALLKKLMDQVGMDAYLQGMKKGYEELRTYVKTESPATLIFQGLLGTKLGAQLGSMLESKATQLEKKYIGKVENSLGDLQKKYSSVLATQK